MWDNVPWLVGGGVEHSVEVSRMLAYVAAGGREGIVGTKDLEVTAQDTPAGSVKVWAGACAIKDRSPVGAYQAFIARHLSPDNVTIAPTGGSGRNDLIVARIHNPYYTGSPEPDPGPDPEDRQNYNYVALDVIPGVNANVKTVTELNLGYTAIPLAIVKLGAGKTTVVQGDITDLRKLVAPTSEPQGRISTPTATRTLTGTGYSEWPTDASVNVDVPDWATHADLKATLGGVQFGASGNNGGAGWQVQGNVQVVLARGTANERTATATAYNVSNESGVDRTTILTGDEVKIPAALRGTTTTLKIQGAKSGGTTSLVTNVGSSIDLRVTFKAKPESNI